MFYPPKNDTLLRFVLRFSPIARSGLLESKNDVILIVVNVTTYYPGRQMTVNRHFY